jgi:hypothetical protein
MAQPLPDLAATLVTAPRDMARYGALAHRNSLAPPSRGGPPVLQVRDDRVADVGRQWEQFPAAVFRAGHGDLALAPVDVLQHKPCDLSRAQAQPGQHGQDRQVPQPDCELAELDLVPNARAQVRINPAVPLFKLYLLNDTEAFFGYYPVQEHKLTLDGEETAIWDLMGKDATLFHHSADGDEDSLSSQYISQSRLWFESIWSTVARDYEP